MDLGRWGQDCAWLVSVRGGRQLFRIIADRLRLVHAGDSTEGAWGVFEKSGRHDLFGSPKRSR